ncbi:hypothetical protein WMF37_39600 [Sorangium sp. So ce291]|uniref:hypothetical protein n=1 Tax=Sorangium sp. So ce291 TaxID=3133294 RepID=UPI003F5F128C
MRDPRLGRRATGRRRREMLGPPRGTRPALPAFERLNVDDELSTTVTTPTGDRCSTPIDADRQPSADEQRRRS